MILAIRTDKPEAELYLLEDSKIVNKIIWQAHRELADTLLSKIEELMNKSSVSLGELTGIIVFTGEGSFTGLRIGTTVANTLAYSLNIPIVSGEGSKWQELASKEITNVKPGVFIVPKYSSEPNITMPKIKVL